MNEASKNVSYLFKRVDLANLLELSDGDREMALRCICIFLDTVPAQLENMKSTLAQNEAGLLYDVLHIIRPQLELVGIKSAREEVCATEAILFKNRVITDNIRKSADYIYNEIILSCNELEQIKSEWS